MARAFTTPVVLPADPTTTLQAATKGYVDTADATKEATANKGAASGYCGLDSSSRVAAANMPLVSSTVGTLTLGTTVTVDATTGNMFNLTINSATTPTLTPSGTNDHQIIQVTVLASGATRTCNVASAVKLSTGLSSRSFSIASGLVLMVAMKYSTLLGAWVMTAATTSA